MKILCPVDGSTHSRWAVKVLKIFPFPKDSSLLLLHIVDAAKFNHPSHASHQKATAAREAVDLALRLTEEAGRRLLERMTTTFESAQVPASAADGWNVESRVIRGDPAQAIMQAAIEQQADVIVMGSRGLTDVRQFLLGSVSRKVVMHASCPVLLIKKQVSAIRRVMVGMDGSKEASHALEFLLRMPWGKGTDIHLVSVVPPLPIETSAEPLAVPPALLKQVRAPFVEKAESLLRQAAECVAQAGLNASTTILHGHPSHEIVKLAETDHADLIIIGSRGLTGAARFLMGSVADGVVKYAGCPVFVFRPPGGG